MSNRILQVQVREHSLDPAQAELWITASAEHVTPATELRGSLAGPRCLYAATVEIGYPLRPFMRRREGMEGLSARVVIPEPSLWEPQCPFVYQGTVELWQDGARCDQVPIRRGLRRVTLGRGGLRVNGRPLALRGRSVDKCDENQIAALHRAVTLAQPEGYVRLFTDEGPPTAALLKALRKQPAAPAYVNGLIAATTTTAARASLPQELVEPLSERELDVLRLLGGDLGGPDIARRLSVSLNTVRTHTKNIYAKLGVTSRRDAVRQARELNLIPGGQRHS
jgi:DNA-binding CsgD family transcriptional regulator